MNASNDSFIMGVFVANGWFTGKMITPASTKFTVTRKEEEESGNEPYMLSTPSDLDCYNGSGNLFLRIRMMAYDLFTSLGYSTRHPFLIYS